MLDKKNICAGIVTYNPDVKKLRENLNHVVDQVERLYIVDNGSYNVEKIKNLLKDYAFKCLLVYNAENMGIAAALNQLYREAQKEGYEWILTLDQDSICSDNLIEVLCAFIDEKCAIIAPKIVYRGNEKYSPNSRSKNNCEVVPWVITSGSLTNIKACESIGGFDEYLFIDKVDYDFCIRLNMAGYKIYQVNTVSLIHELGNLKCRKIAGKTIYVTNHSAFRKYYISRNSIYLSRKLKDNAAMIYILKNIVKVVCFENDKINKLKAIQKGISDGKKKLKANFHFEKKSDRSV